mmetsp:Transcript_1909/g.2902  ORF Transcript_1909/g.2902 Transcript_1909/m.2902 type:complete len:256 (+) Transcript_1909:127-894(+)
MVAMSVLSDAVVLEILHNLDPEELRTCFATSTSVNCLASSNILWFRLYCSKYRGHFTPPPTFQELVAGAFSELNLDSLPWRVLVRIRIASSSDGPPTERLVGGGLHLEEAPMERWGMIDAEHVTRWPQCMVLRQPLQAMPLGRPVAYAELLVHGGASVGLVDSCHYAPRSHVGWRPESLGYHGDDGSLFANRCFGSVKFGPTFGLDPELVVPDDRTQAPRRADVIGVGIDHGSEEGKVKTAFFTKNGGLVGSVVT